MIFDTISGSRFTYDTGTNGTVTVPAGKYVISITVVAPAGSSATLTITPGGPNQKPVAGSSILIPSTVSMSIPMQAQLGPGTVLVFGSTDSYFVGYAQFTAGGP